MRTVVTIAGVLLVCAMVALAYRNSREPRVPPITQDAPDCGVSCGAMRPSVRSLSDRDHKKISFVPEPATVAYLAAVVRPEILLENGRATPEKQTFELQALLVGFQTDAADRSLRILIADPEVAGRSMVVAIPDAACAGFCSSPIGEKIRAARQNFLSHCGEPSQVFRKLREPLAVKVRGIGFFDPDRGPQGADNGFELRPVLRIDFPDADDECKTLAGP